MYAFRFYNYIKNSINKNKYNFRKSISNINYLYDKRFLNNLDQYYFPFEKCSSITCTDNNNNKININDKNYNNIKNLAIKKNYSSNININSIKVFCQIPSKISIIKCEMYPWENIANFIIDENNDLKIV